MRRVIITLALMVGVSSGLFAQEVVGDWLGTLDAGAVSLRLVLHIVNTDAGLTATLDSPDQGAKGIPVTKIVRTGEALRCEVGAVGGVIEGTFDKGLQTIAGTWAQGGNKLPLVLKRVVNTTELERRRPQNPTRPFPYHDEEVRYDNKTAGATLAATLTLPQGKGPFPAVVLVTGSGPEDRDETVFGHRPFLVLADCLTRRGIAVLRADDRGTGKSTGSYSTATTADFATDVEAGITYLRTRPEIDKSRIGLIGHSEGGVIAPMVAARTPGVAFIVLMAGTGVKGDEVLVEQVRLLARASGKSETEADGLAAQQREVLALIQAEKDNAVLEKKLREKFGDLASDGQMSIQIKAIQSPWFRYFMQYDPAVALRKTTCPVLAINGERDVQVSSRQNLPAIRRALEEAGNRDFETVELPGLNHLFQTSKTGSVGEYVEIEETVSPVALERVATWILEHTQPAR
ncbi:MAG: alpha/beta fold hydrolase [Acidobacteria bacterium]|nr:alpha/beta fold hydrolase [Acidobacteriota bacterium]